MIYISAFSDEAASDLQGQIDALKRNGIFYTELRSISGKNVADLTVAEAENICEELQKNGIKVWSVGSPLGKVDIDVDFQEYENKVRHVCCIAKALKTDKIRIFSFFNAYQKREKVLLYLRKMVAIAAEYGVELYHENEKDVYGDRVERVLELLNNVEDLKCIYDPANFLQVGESAQYSLDVLHQRADYFHIKDVIFETGELVPAGYGDGKIDELVRRIDGDKVLTLEPHLMVFDAYASIDKAEMKLKFRFENNNEAFDAAVSALKKILTQNGYTNKNGGYEK